MAFLYLRPLLLSGATIPSGHRVYTGKGKLILLNRSTTLPQPGPSKWAFYFPIYFLLCLFLIPPVENDQHRVLEEGAKDGEKD